MLLGISSKVLRDYRLEDAIAIAGSCGYDAIEIWIDDYISSGMTPEEVIKLTDEQNLKRTVHLRTDDLNICSFNKGIREESVKQMKDGIRIASQIKAEEATLHPGRKTSKTHSLVQAWEVQIDSVKEISREASRWGVTLCVEGMEKTGTDFVLTPDDLSRILNECNNESVGVTIDIAHLQTIGDAKEVLEGCRALPVQNVHISQTTKDALHLPLYQGVGDIDYSVIFKLLRTFYNKAVIVEGYKRNSGREIAENTIMWYRKVVEGISGNEE